MPHSSPDPLSVYQERRNAFAADLAAAHRSANSLSNARLAVALAAFAGFIWFVFRDDLIPCLAIVAAGVGLFVFLMARHDKVLAREAAGTASRTMAANIPTRTILSPRTSICSDHRRCSNG
jgi:hypothetical protein